MVDFNKLTRDQTGKRVLTGAMDSVDSCREAAGENEIESRDGKKNRDQQRLLRLARLQA